MGGAAFTASPGPPADREAGLKGLTGDPGVHDSVLESEIAKQHQPEECVCQVGIEAAEGGPWGAGPGTGGCVRGRGGGGGAGPAPLQESRTPKPLLAPLRPKELCAELTGVTPGG